MVHSFRSIALILALGLVGIASPWGAAPQRSNPVRRPSPRRRRIRHLRRPRQSSQSFVPASTVRVDVIVSARDGKPVLDLSEKISRSSRTESPKRSSRSSSSRSAHSVARSGSTTSDSNQ